MLLIALGMASSGHMLGGSLPECIELRLPEAFPFAVSALRSLLVRLSVCAWHGLPDGIRISNRQSYLNGCAPTIGRMCHPGSRYIGSAITTGS